MLEFLEDLGVEPDDKVVLVLCRCLVASRAA